MNDNEITVNLEKNKTVERRKSDWQTVLKEQYEESCKFDQLKVRKFKYEDVEIETINGTKMTVKGWIREN
ncbi:hypothetical protein NUSPORA_01462 [Nucleospora cyclopteri]